MSLATSSFLRTIIKAVESHLGQRLPRFRRGTVVGQSGNPLKVLVAPSGEQGVADGFEYPVLRSYTSVTVDDPGGPHVGDDLLVLETSPNNPVLLGQLLTGPNDKANRDSYPGIDKVSITQNDVKKLRAHAIVISHLPPTDADVPADARDGMHIVSTYDNSDWVRSSGVWERISLPVGGTAGQALAKVSGTDYDVSWQTLSGGGGSRRAANYTIDNDFTVTDRTQAYVPWNECVNGASVYHDPAHTDGLTIPSGGAGDYWVHTQLRLAIGPLTLTGTTNWSVEYELSIELYRAGVQIMYADREDIYQDHVAAGAQFWTDPIIDVGAVVPDTQTGDVIKIGINLTGGDGLAGHAIFHLWGGWAGSAAVPDPTEGWYTWVSIAPMGG